MAQELTSNTDNKDATDPTQCNVSGSCSREDSGASGGAGYKLTATRAVSGTKIGAMPSPRGGAFGGVGAGAGTVAGSGTGASAMAGGGIGGVGGGCAGGGDGAGGTAGTNAVTDAGGRGGGGGHRGGRAIHNPTVSGDAAVAVASLGSGVVFGDGASLGAGTAGVCVFRAPAVAAATTATATAAATAAAVSGSAIAGAAAAATAAFAGFSHQSSEGVQVGNIGSMKAPTVPPPPSTVLSTTALGRPVAALGVIPTDGVAMGSVIAPPRPLGSGMDVADDVNPTTNADDMEECDLPARGLSHIGTQVLAMDVPASTSLITGDNMEECDLPAGGSSGGGAHLCLASAGLPAMPWQPPPQQRTQAAAHRIPYAPMPMDCGQETTPPKGVSAAGIAGRLAMAAGGGSGSAGFTLQPAMSRSQITRNAAIASGVSGFPGTGSTGSSSGASSKPGGAAGWGNGLGASSSIRHSASLAAPQANGRETNLKSGQVSAGIIWAGGSSTATSHAWGVGGSSLPRAGGASGGFGSRSSMIAAPAPSVGQAGARRGVWGVARGSSNMGWGSRGSGASTGMPVTGLASNTVSYLRAKNV